MSQPRPRSASKWTCCRTSRGMVRVCLAWLQSASCPIGRIQSESSGFHAQGKLHEWSDASLRCASRLFLATIFQGTVGWWRHRVLGQSRWASSGGRDGHVSNLDGDRWRRVGAWHWAASVTLGRRVTGRSLAIRKPSSAAGCTNLARPSPRRPSRLAGVSSCRSRGGFGCVG